MVTDVAFQSKLILCGQDGADDDEDSYDDGDENVGDDDLSALLSDFQSQASEMTRPPSPHLETALEAAGTEAVMNEGAEIPEPSEAEIRLPEGAEIRLPEGAEIRLPEGPEIRLPEGAEIRLPEGPEIRLPEGPEIRLPEGAEIGKPGPGVVVVDSPQLTDGPGLAIEISSQDSARALEMMPDAPPTELPTNEIPKPKTTFVPEKSSALLSLCAQAYMEGVVHVEVV